MKKVLLAILACMMTVTGFTAPKNVKFYDAREMTIVNRAENNGDFFRRVDVEKYPDLSKTARLYLTYPTGMAVRFRTNSPFIQANWVVKDTLNSPNRMPLSAKGLDLYIQKDGKWLWAGVARPKYVGAKNSYKIVSGMDNSMKECMLYLPMFVELEDLKIGVAPDSEIIFEKGIERSPIIAVGSSYTHGTSTSRPAMAWPAQLSRRLGVNIANIGTSGIQKMEPFYANMVAGFDTDMFIFDTFSNPTAEEIRARFKNFVKTIRAKHPNTPLVFLQTFYRESSNFELAKRKEEDEKRKAADEVMAEAMKTDKNIYYLKPGLYAGDDHESTCDGTHPSDLGYQRAVDNIEPQVRKLMKKYRIK